jgi:hypothetical protein
VLRASLQFLPESNPHRQAHVCALYKPRHHPRQQLRGAACVWFRPFLRGRLHHRSGPVSAAAHRPRRISALDIAALGLRHCSISVVPGLGGRPQRLDRSTGRKTDEATTLLAAGRPQLGRCPQYGQHFTVHTLSREDDALSREAHKPRLDACAGPGASPEIRNSL